MNNNYNIRGLPSSDPVPKFPYMAGGVLAAVTVHSLDLYIKWNETTNIGQNAFKLENLDSYISPLPSVDPSGSSSSSSPTMDPSKMPVVDVPNLDPPPGPGLKPMPAPNPPFDPNNFDPTQPGVGDDR